MSVGDVHSDARGSGARYNDGKAPLELIPLTVIAESYAHLHDCDVRYALLDLGRFQTTGDVQCLTDALTMLTDNWRDCAAVFDYGRKKYAEWNWAKGMAWSIPLACAARHALAILEGEEIDPESSLPHVGHLLCNIVMLRTFVDTYPEGCDLPPPRLFARIPPSPDYDPASVAFRHGDLESVCGVSARADKQDYRYARSSGGSSHAHPTSAPELADADGVGEYGNPVTPGCATGRLP